MDLPCTPFFVGRDTFLDTLRTKFVKNQIIAISGANGTGKTAALQEYTQRFVQYYQVIIWFNMATDETFLSDLIAALQAYSLPIEIKRGTEYLFHTLHDYIRQQQNALLILDNFSSNFIMQDLSEQQPDMHIGIIMQGQQAPPEVSGLELTGLNATDATVLFLRLAGLLSPQETLDQIGDELRGVTLELVGAFHGMPITLYLAGCYLSLTGSSVQEYLSTFRDAPVPGYLPAGVDEDAIKSFVAVCERNLSYVRETDTAAFERLRLTALLLPDDIPSVLFLSANERDVTENETGKESQIMRRLLDAGLISVTQHTSFMSMHRLIQDVVLQSLTDEQQQQGIKQIVLLLRQSLPQIQSEPLPVRVRVAGQIRHLASISESDSAFSNELINVNEAADLFTWAATLFWDQQLVGMPEALLRRALSIWLHTLGDAHPIVANVLANLVTMNGLLKNYVDAEAFAHQAIVSRTNASGINHPELLTMLDQLGRLYAEQGKQNQACQCYEKAIAIGDTVKLQHDPAYITAMYDLALLYMTQKSWVMAGTLLRKVCIARTSSSGSQDPDTLAAWFSLADVSIQQKDWQWAYMAYQRALPSWEEMPGDEQPRLLKHLEQFADVLLQLGKIDEANQQLQRIQNIKQQAF